MNHSTSPRWLCAIVCTAGLRRECRSFESKSHARHPTPDHPPLSFVKFATTLTVLSDAGPAQSLAPRHVATDSQILALGLPSLGQRSCGFSPLGKIHSRITLPGCRWIPHFAAPQHARLICSQRRPVAVFSRFVVASGKRTTSTSTPKRLSRTASRVATKDGTRSRRLPALEW